MALPLSVEDKSSFIYASVFQDLFSKTKTVERISQRNIIRKKCDYIPVPNAFPKLTGMGSKQKCT